MEWLTKLALSTLWGWFIAPVFGVAQIGIMQAYGLILTANVLRVKIPVKEAEEASFGDRMACSLVFCPQLLLGFLLV